MMASFFFTCAFLHIFLADLAHARFPRTLRNPIFSDAGAIFLAWAFVFLIFFSFQQGLSETQKYLHDRSFQEPFLAGIILLVCAARPILELAQRILIGVANVFHQILGISHGIAVYVSLLWITPLLGSLLTEMVAMSLASSLFLVFFGAPTRKLGFYAATLGLLWVNVSIGGAITPYAAPCILLVSRSWGWNSSFLLQHFAFKSIFASFLAVLGFAFWYRKELQDPTKKISIEQKTPFWLHGIQILFLLLFLINPRVHEIIWWWSQGGLLALYLLFWKCTHIHQGSWKETIPQALQVTGFLTALIILNGFPGEEIESFFTKASARQVYLGSIFLTSFLDNVVLTHLGTQIQGLSEAHRYYLVAGGLAGGGLTLFANAPNLLGYQVLKKKFPDLKAWQCTMGALFPTLIAILFFWKKTF